MIEFFVISGHMDSRNKDVMDADGIARREPDEWNGSGEQPL